MKKFLSWVAILMLGLVALGGAFGLTVGGLAPDAFEGSYSRVYAGESPERAWKVLNDIEGLPQRRREISKIEVLDRNPQYLKRWKEYTDMEGHMIFVMKEWTPKSKMSVEMIESTFGLTGTWSYQIVPRRNGIEVKFDEKSLTRSIWVRAIMTLVGRNANLRAEADYLEQGLRELRR